MEQVPHSRPHVQFAACGCDLYLNLAKSCITRILLRFVADGVLFAQIACDLFRYVAYGRDIGRKIRNAACLLRKVTQYTRILILKKTTDQPDSVNCSP